MGSGVDHMTASPDPSEREDFSGMSDAEDHADQSGDRSGQSSELADLAAALGAVARGLRSAAHAIPGVSVIGAQAGAGERFLLRQIKRRLDQVDGARTSRGE